MLHRNWMTPTSLIPISTLVYSRHRLLHPHSSLIPTNIQARANAHLLTYIHLHTRSLTHISHSGSVYLHVLPCCTKKRHTYLHAIPTPAIHLRNTRTFHTYAYTKCQYHHIYKQHTAPEYHVGKWSSVDASCFCFLWLQAMYVKRIVFSSVCCQK